MFYFKTKNRVIKKWKIILGLKPCHEGPHVEYLKGKQFLKMPHSNQNKEILNKAMKYKECSDLDAIPNVKTESYEIILLFSRPDESL